MNYTLYCQLSWNCCINSSVDRLKSQSLPVTYVHVCKQERLIMVGIPPKSYIIMLMHRGHTFDKELAAILRKEFLTVLRWSEVRCTGDILLFDKG